MKKQQPKYHIMWQKWYDPITKMKQEAQKQNRIQKLQQQNEFESSYDNPQQITSVQPFSFMQTPMGLMPTPIPDIANFNFWIGHTNFNLTRQILEVIELTPGVEALNVFSPYRFRIAVGQAFDENSVKTSIAVLCRGLLLKNDSKKNCIANCDRDWETVRRKNI